jgi:hypothetical protein
LEIVVTKPYLSKEEQTMNIVYTIFSEWLNRTQKKAGGEIPTRSWSEKKRGMK